MTQDTAQDIADWMALNGRDAAAGSDKDAAL